MRSFCKAASHFVLFALALTCGATASAANEVSGTLTVNGSAYPMAHITAVRLPSSFVDGALVTRVALSDTPVPEGALRDSFGLLSLRQKGSVHAVILEFSDNRSFTTLSIASSDHSVSISLSGTLDQLNLSTHTPERIEGTLKQEERAAGETRFAIDLSFAADVAAFEAPKTGLLKKGAEAQSLDSVKAYLAMRKAVRAGDLAAIQKVARYPQDFEGPDGAKFLKFMQSEEPQGIQVVEASEGPDTATLTVTGTLEGKPIRRTFNMQKKEGRWTTNNDNWQAN